VGAMRSATETASRPARSKNNAFDDWLARYSFPLLRISMGLVVLGFGFLKYFPGVSPAQALVLHVNRVLTFGLMPDRVTLVLFATVESVLGLVLITGLGLRYLIYPLTVWAFAILSPVVLFPGELFSEPHHAPTLEGQYVLKDIILLAACLVIMARVRVQSRG
jgi:putative oxidoreductase